MNAPGPKALVHFRRGRARPLGTAAAADEGIPRLRRRRPRWSHGADSAQRDGGRSGGGGGRDQVSSAWPPWQEGMGCTECGTPRQITGPVWKPDQGRGLHRAPRELGDRREGEASGSLGCLATCPGRSGRNGGFHGRDTGLEPRSPMQEGPLWSGASISNEGRPDIGAQWGAAGSGVDPTSGLLAGLRGPCRPKCASA